MLPHQVCYRRNGHNEMDMPMFTQPLMYQKIAKHKPILDSYVEDKIKEGVLDVADFEVSVYKLFFKFIHSSSTE